MDPVFADSFKFAKLKGGEFTINYMLASLNKEAMAGEFFLEFDEYVWEHKLVQCFETLGAGQVSVVTFQNNDGNESASDALLRLHTQANGVPYERGTCPPALHAKVQAKLAAFAKRAEAGARELDEKTQLAIKQSLADLDDKIKATQTIIRNNQSMLNQTQSTVSQTQSTVALIDVKMEEVQNGVCSIIPDYQKEIEQLKARLAHKTREVDRIEGQKGRLTHVNNELTAVKEGLEWQLKRKTEELDRKAMEWQIERATLLEQVNLCKTIEEAKQIKDYLEADRELKRSRSD